MTLPVSVVIPTYNRAHLLRRAIGSVLSQCQETDEALVIDDGSTDGTAEIAACYGDRIRYISRPHRGAGYARNTGIRVARHPIVAFLDSDDEWLPGKLELQRQVLGARPDLMFCCSDIQGCDGEGRIDHHLLRSWHGDPRSWDDILAPGIPYSSLAELAPGQIDFSVHIGDLALPEMQSAYVSTITLMVRRDKAGKALHFAEDVETFEDLECFGRLALLGSAAYLDCETARNHGHTGARLTDAHSLAKATSRLTILERVWGNDAKFLSRHGREYARAVWQTRHIQARALLLAGDKRQARELLSQLPFGAGWVDRLALHLPGHLFHRLRWLRRMVFRPSA